MALTPCAVIYQVVSQFVGKRKNDEIDACILSRDPFDKKGRSPFDRALEDLAWRTREIVQKNPHDLSSSMFVEPSKAAGKLISYLKRSGYGNRDIVDTFVACGRQEMIESLKAYNYDYHLFANTLDDIVANQEARLADYTLAVVTLFTAVAFYGEPRSALTNILIRRSVSFPDINFGTRQVSDKEIFGGPHDGVSRLALIRCYEDGSMDNEVHFLSAAGRGTIVGRASAAEGSINNVDPSVSREHLEIIFREGSWVARGLGSTNGTKVIHADGNAEVVEYPKGSGNQEAHEVDIVPGDTLALGIGTTFKVVVIAP